MRKILRLIIITLVVLMVAAQFFPVTRDNPPIAADFSDNPEVRQVLKQSCYDCHSNETVWPWYSRIAPASWLLSSDVTEAREKLNFSEWGLMPPAKQAHAREEIGEEVREGKMPLPIYLLMHSDASLTDSDKIVLQGWTGVPTP